MSLVFNPKTLRAQSTRIRFYLKTDIPPAPNQFDPPSTRIWWRGHWKRIFSKTLSRVKIFENAGISFMSGRTKIQWCHISYTANPLLSPPGGLIQTLLRGQAELNRDGGALFKLFSETHQRGQGLSRTDLWFPGVILLFLTIRKWWQFSTEN